jgi:hypothetical protein
MRDRLRWGVCPDGHWGEAPPHFHSVKHRLICGGCGKQMFVSPDPRTAGYRDKDNVEVKTAKETEQP